MIKNAKIVGNNVDPAVYNAEEHERGTLQHSVRSHTLCEVLRNPRRWRNGYVSPESESKEWGSLWDCELLTPWQRPQRFAVLPADAPRRPSKTQLNAKKPSAETLAAIEWWRHWEEGHKGAEVVKAEYLGLVQVAVNRLLADPMLADLIGSSQKQVMIRAEWHDTPTGLVVPLKCLIDAVPFVDHPVFSNSIWDTKTTRNASPRQFSKDAYRYNYHIQGGFYLDLYNAATGEKRGDFGHVVQENYAPFEHRSPPPLLTQRFLNLGVLMYQKALGLYCQCLAKGVWPGYDAPPEWPKTDCEDWALDPERIYERMPDMPEDEEPEPTDEPAEAPKDDTPF